MISGRYDYVIFTGCDLSYGAVSRRHFQAIGLPRIIGMLATGILTGTYVLDLLDPKILGISSELRQIALIIILIKAGLSLNLSDLKRWADLRS